MRNETPSFRKTDKQERPDCPEKMVPKRHELLPRPIQYYGLSLYTHVMFKQDNLSPELTLILLNFKYFIVLHKINKYYRLKQLLISQNQIQRNFDISNYKFVLAIDSFCTCTKILIFSSVREVNKN